MQVDWDDSEKIRQTSGTLISINHVCIRQTSGTLISINHV